MESPIEIRRVEIRDEINSDCTIDSSKQCNFNETPINTEFSAKTNSNSAIGSSNQSKRSKLPINCEDLDSIHDTVMEELEVNPDVMEEIGRFNAPKNDKYSASINGIPNVPEGVTPILGLVFQTIGHCIDKYKNYAAYVGFDIRRFTEHTFKDKFVRLKHLVCHRSGVPNKRSVDSIKDGKRRKGLRNSNFKVTGCKAQVRFRRVSGTSQFKLFYFYFYPNHNHDLLDENDKMLSRYRRQLNVSNKMFVHRATRANIGASKAHRIQVCLKGGYEEVGCSRTDYKNFKRDLDSFICDGDVQMVLNMFNERVINGTNFAYQFKVSEGKLEGLFWADELS